MADYGKNCIQKFDSNGNFITKWGRKGGGDGEFDSPSAIALGPDGSVYVKDLLNWEERIQKFDGQGKFVGRWGSRGVGDGQFSGVSGIAVGPDGSVYIADAGNLRVQKFDSTGIFITKWGGVGNGNGQFYFPEGIAIGADDFIYVAERGNDRIQKFDLNGAFIAKWGSYGKGDGEFDSPWGIAVGFDGFVYVVDTYNHRVQKFDNKGTFIKKWGNQGAGDGQFSYPKGIAVGPDGSVYVVDYGNDRIQKFDSQGSFITKWGGSHGSGDGQFNFPNGIAVGPDGSIYVADSQNSRIQRFDPNGSFISKWGGYGTEDGQFLYPHGIAIGLNGSVYVTDAQNYCIQKFDSRGNFVDKWGERGSEDGKFDFPDGIGIGADGSVYVADQYNHRIERYIPETLFETALPIDQQANTSQEYTTNIPNLNVTGKLYLETILANKLGQTVARAGYYYYIYEGNTLLSLGTDRRVYRPGETVVITGQVENRAAIAADGLVLTLAARLGAQSSELISAGPFSISANGTYPFNISTTAETEGTIILTGKVTQNESSLAEVNEQYEVAKPKVSVSVTVPDVVGSDPFLINVQIKNAGKREATVQFGVQGAEFRDSQGITLAAGETKVLEYTQQISTNTTYTFTFTGDWEQTINKTVSYGLIAYIDVYPDAILPEGNVGVPVWISNSGPLNESISISYQLTPGSGQQSKVYYLSPWGGVSDTLYFNLNEGDYQITASSQVPQASGQARFSVRKMDKVDMAVSLGAQADGLIPVSLNLTNQGYNNVSGSVSVSVSEQNQTLWSSQQTVSSLPTQTSQLFSFNVNPGAMVPGHYTIRVDFLNARGQSLAMSSSSFALSGPSFQITQVPAFQTFYPGVEASLSFRVKNAGDQEGAMGFYFKANDLIDLTRTEWLKAGEERDLPFSFVLPVDLEEKDYFADYEMKASGVQEVEGSRGQVKYHLAGINLNVTAALDKPYYQEGETAHLVLSISSLNTPLSALSLFARVNYPGYESKQSFSLSGSQPLSFDIPLAQITGEKLFYGIYHESGRSIHLNSLYIHKAGDVLTITTDKQVYQPGETVSVSVSGTISGTLHLIGPNYDEALPFAGTVAEALPYPL